MRRFINTYFIRSEYAKSPEVRKRNYNIYKGIVKGTVLIIFLSVILSIILVNGINLIHLVYESRASLRSLMNRAEEYFPDEELNGLQEYTEEEWKRLLLDDGKDETDDKITNADSYFIVHFDPETLDYEIDRAAGGIADANEMALMTENLWKKWKVSGYKDGYFYQGEKAENSDIVFYILHDIGKEIKAAKKTLFRSMCMGVLCALFLVEMALLFLNREISRMAEINTRQKMFVADAGHEIKTPLSIINGDLEILEMEHGEDEWTRSIHHQVHRLYDLTEALMLQAKCEEKLGQELHPVNMKRVIEEALEEFLPLAVLNRQQFHLDLPENILLSGDPEMFRKLFSLLIDNAIRYASQESIIEIVLRSTKSEVTVLLKNKAEGLEKKDYDVLFQRFYRRDFSRNSENAGYGMGLAIARAITENYNGVITAESPDGKHMIFHLAFKVEDDSRKLRSRVHRIRKEYNFTEKDAEEKNTDNKYH